MRRRGFGFGRPLARRAALPADEIGQAHALFAAGHYSAAAQWFETLAQNHPARAPFLLLQGGRAHLLAGSLPAGMSCLRRGLLLLSERGQIVHFQRAGRQAMQELLARGFEAQAAEIQTILNAQMSALADLPTQRNDEHQRPPLPSHCPSCGGPLRPDEVDWLDNFSVECPFCGSPVKTVSQR